MKFYRLKRINLLWGNLILMFFIGCAATRVQPPSIPAGKTKLVLEAGGVESLNFTVFDKNTGKEVLTTTGLSAFLSPGTYKVVVQTDINQPVVLDSVKLLPNQLEKHVEVPVGRFIMTVSETYKDEQGAEKSKMIRPRFTIYDYNMTRPLAEGVTTFPPKRYVLPLGDYKVDIKLLGTLEGRIIKEVKIRFGRIYPVEFRFTHQVQ